MKNIKAPTIYLIYVSISALLFIIIKNAREIYFINVAHLNALQLVLLGTTLEVTNFIFEIPTGVVADRYSRKLSIIIGLFLTGFSFILEGIYPLFFILVISQFIWGLGGTFTSGADEAWIVDETKGENIDKLFLQGAQLGQFLSIFGIIISTFIGYVDLRLPFIASGALFILLGFFLILFMKEANFEKSNSDHNLIRTMTNSFRLITHTIINKPILLFMFWLSLFYGLYSEGFDRLWTAHLTVQLPTQYPPIIYIGLINLVAMVLSIIAVQYIKHRLIKTGKMQRVWLLFVINLLMVVTLFGFAISGEFYLASSLYISFYIVRRINTPVYRAWLNQQIESRNRATLLSAYGQIDSLGQIIGGPIIGLIALSTSFSIGILVSACILSPVLVIYLFLIRKARIGDMSY